MIRKLTRTKRVLLVSVVATVLLAGLGLLAMFGPGTEGTADASSHGWPWWHHGKPHPTTSPSSKPTGYPSLGPSPSANPRPSVSMMPSSSPIPSGVNGGQPVATHGGAGVHLRQVDGGPNYFAKFSPSLPVDPAFFPIGVWYESVVAQGDIDKDKVAGLNTYVQLTDSTKMNLIAGAGMYAIQSDPARAGTETVGWELPDEADMWAGPGSAAWTGRYAGEGTICSPAGSDCGYTVHNTILNGYPADSRFRYANYGKGVTFWDTDSEAATFVNKFQDVLSADNYWLTDENICIKSEGGGMFPASMLVPGQNGGSNRLPDPLCHRPSNYGLTVDRLRSLVSPAGSKPVWAFVEVGHPNKDSDSSLSAQPAQIVAAVWSSIIHGARGIIYFNHSFGGPCQTQHALRDPCYTSVRTAVTAVDTEIRQLAPVLNAPFADGVLTTGGSIDASAKWYGGHYYVLAGSTQAAAQSAALAMPCVGNATVTVVNENRTLKMTNGTFTDSFADGNAVHIYRVDGGSSCGAY